MLKENYEKNTAAYWAKGKSDSAKEGVVKVENSKREEEKEEEDEENEEEKDVEDEDDE